MDRLSNTKICEVSTRHRTDDSRIFIKISRSLKKICDNVSFVGVGNESLVKDGINLIGVPPCKKSISLCQIKRVLITYRRAIKENADLYHLHTPELIPLGLYLKLKPKRVVYDQHEFVNVTVRGWPLLRALRFFLKHFFWWLEGLAYRYFDLIVCNTEGIYEVAKGNKCVVANFVDVDLIEKIDYKKNKTFSVVYAGGLSLDRSIYDLVESVGELNKEGVKVHLDLMGRWEKGFKEECQSLPGWDSVTYLGFKNVSEVYQYTLSSNIGLAILYPRPNYLVALPVKVFEYMAFSIPSIISDFPYWKEIFADSALFVNPKNPEDIADKIKILIEDKKLREKLGKKGRELVETKYNWEKESEKLIKLYKDLS